MMEFILKNGIVYDPANGINGEKKDIMVKDDIIVEEVSANAKVIDVTNKIVNAWRVPVVCPKVFFTSASTPSVGFLRMMSSRNAS